MVTQANNLISMREISSESELGRRLVTSTSAVNLIGCIEELHRMRLKTGCDVRNEQYNPGLRWLDTVCRGQYLPSLSVNYDAINKD